MPYKTTPEKALKGVNPHFGRPLEGFSSRLLGTSQKEVKQKKKKCQLPKMKVNMGCKAGWMVMRASYGEEQYRRVC